MSGAEPRAKQILGDLVQRPTLGDRLLRKIGRRAWSRPRLGVSPRLFKLYGIPDPWDPGSKEKDWESRLGPVSLRLGSNRRQPAPHLKPKETRKPKPQPQASAAQRFKPKGIPQAKQTEKRPPAPPPKKAPSREFGGRPKPKLKGKFPVRPDLADRLGAAPEAPAPAEKPSSGRKTARLRPQSGGQATRASRPAPSADELAQRRPPRIESPSKPSSGRVRMRRTKARSASRRSLAPPEKPAPAEASPAPPQKPAKPQGAVDLDDLFGIPVSKEDRPRLRRPKKK